MSRNNMYDMYPYANQADTAPLTLRATLEEAAAKGWYLDDADLADATHVEVACRADWEASQRPLSAQVAKFGAIALNQ